MGFEIGQGGILTKTVGDEDVRQFAHLVGDANPVHLDDAYARSTRFGKRIAHGMFSASLISAVLGTKFPGPGTIYLSQSLQFKAPVYIGDTITAKATLLKIHERKPILALATVCVNQRGEEVLSGEAVVLYEPVSQSAGRQ